MSVRLRVRAKVGIRIRVRVRVRVRVGVGVRVKCGESWNGPWCKAVSTKQVPLPSWWWIR